VGVASLSSLSKARPSPRSSSTVLSRSTSGVEERLLLGSDDKSSLAVVKDSACEDGYGKSGGRSTVRVFDMAVLLEPAVRGGLGSGVGGLRALTGVLRADIWEAMEPTMLFRLGCVSREMAADSSLEADGGVGGSPLLSPLFTNLGDARGVDWLLPVIDAMS
jgi:hypothetical protein